MFRNVFGGCVSDHGSRTDVFRSPKLKFGASLSSALKHGYLPGPLVDILVHIAKEGIMTADVFRRPGNPNDMRRIVKRLTEGKTVVYSNFSIYTLASVVKKFLLKIPGGVFTPEGEERLLQVLSLSQKMEQIEAVHSFMTTLTPAHQQLIALLFGTWFRIVSFQAQNCMSVEALSRSVAGSMFHTCAEDPAKVEKASRIMEFLIDNYGVEGMFGQENIRFFAETSHTIIHIRELYNYSYVHDTQLIPPVMPEFIEVSRLEKARDDEENEGQNIGRDKRLNDSPQASPVAPRHSRDDGDHHDDDSQLMINTSTLSAPEVSLVPSPDVSKRPKSLEDNLNEFRSHYQSRCLSRYNSVKRKQLERLRQRSDWFLSPIVRERNNSRKGRGDWDIFPFSRSILQAGSEHCRNGNEDCKNNCGNAIGHNGSKRVLQQKNSGNSTVTKASSEGAVPESFSDGDSIFTDNTSRSESPASEPVWSRVLKAHSRDAILSDTIDELVPPELSPDEGSPFTDLSDSFSGVYFMEMSPLSVRSKVVEEVEEEEEDDKNITPPGVQEQDDILSTSNPDLQPKSSVEVVQLAQYGDVGKDSSEDQFYECAENIEPDKVEQECNFEFQDFLHQSLIGSIQGTEFTQGQQLIERTVQSETVSKEDMVREGRNVEGGEVSSTSREPDMFEDVQSFMVERTYGKKFSDS